MAKSDAQRKRDERQRKKEHLKEVGAQPFNMTMFSGTSDALDRIMEVGEFEERAEAVTVLIHNVEKLIDSDMSRFKEFMNVTCLRSD